MKLITQKYEIEHIDTIIEGGYGYEADYFKVKVEGVEFEIDYSREDKQIVMSSLSEDYLNQAEERGEKEENAWKCLKYLDYELKTVCEFMLSLY